MTGPPSSTSRDIAGGLVARELAEADGPAAVGAALQRVWTLAAGNLRRSVGDDGCSALFARALARTQAQHPLLIDLVRPGEAVIYPDGVLASINTHGVPAVRAAIESFLAEIAEVLGSLIGADMVHNLLTDGRSQDQAVRPRQGHTQ